MPYETGRSRGNGQAARARPSSALAETLPEAAGFGAMPVEVDAFRSGRLNLER
jgi:hypothetical protein